MTTQTEALKLALDGGGLYEITGRIEDIDKCIVHRSVIKETLAQPEQEPVAFITPLMEQQLFDDWCPYKWNPDPRVVWAAAIDAVNGLLIGATPPQRKPLTDDELDLMCEKALFCRISFQQFARSIEAAHGIKGDA